MPEAFYFSSVGGRTVPADAFHKLLGADVTVGLHPIIHLRFFGAVQVRHLLFDVLSHNLLDKS